MRVKVNYTGQIRDQQQAPVNTVLGFRRLYKQEICWTNA
jgi:hypothetical protein